MSDKLYSILEAAKVIGVHPQTIKYHKYVSQYLQEYGVVVGKSLIFTKSEVKFLKANWRRLIPMPGRKAEVEPYRPVQPAGHLKRKKRDP